MLVYEFEGHTSGKTFIGYAQRQKIGKYYYRKMYIKMYTGNETVMH
jgi:hypothetical protein